MIVGMPPRFPFRHAYHAVVLREGRRLSRRSHAPAGRRRTCHAVVAHLRDEADHFGIVLASPNSQAPRSLGGEDSPARATPKVRPTGRAVRLEVFPPPPLCRPLTRPLPTFRVRNAFRCLAGPFFFVAPGSLAPPFETRPALPPLFLAILLGIAAGSASAAKKVKHPRFIYRRSCFGSESMSCSHLSAMAKDK